MEGSGLETDEADSGIILGSAWAPSVIVLVVFTHVALWLGYGRVLDPLISLTPFLPIAVLLLVRSGLGRQAFCSRPLTPGKSTIAWPSILWVFTLSYFGGGGVMSYLPYPLSAWIFSLLLAAGPIVFLISVKHGERLSLSDLGFRRSCLPRTLGFLAVVTAMFVPVTAGAWWSGVFSDTAAAVWVELLITSTLMPALFEEIAFRGLIQDSVSARYDSRLSGVLVASLFFGIGHIFTDSGDYNDIVLGFLLCFALQFIGGLCLGVIYEATGNLTSSIALHYLWNFFVWVSNVDWFSESAASYGYLGMLIAVPLPIAVGGWNAIRRLPRYVGRLYYLIRRIAHCMMNCVRAELKRIAE